MLEHNPSLIKIKTSTTRKLNILNISEKSQILIFIQIQHWRQCWRTYFFSYLWLNWIRQVGSRQDRSTCFLVHEYFHHCYHCLLLDQVVHWAVQQCLLRVIFLYAKRRQQCLKDDLLIEPMEKFDEKAFKIKVEYVYLTVHNLFYEIIDKTNEKFRDFWVFDVCFCAGIFCLLFT